MFLLLVSTKTAWVQPIQWLPTLGSRSLNGLDTPLGYNSADHLLLHSVLLSAGDWFGLFLVQPARMGKRILNQADSLLMTKMQTQTDEVQGSGDLQTRCLLQYSVTCEREEEAPACRKCC